MEWSYHCCAAAACKGILPTSSLHSLKNPGKLERVISHIIFKFLAVLCKVFKLLPYMRLTARGSCPLSSLLFQLLLPLNCHSLLADSSLSRHLLLDCSIVQQR